MAKARRTNIRQEHPDGSATIDLNQPPPAEPLDQLDKLPDYGAPAGKQADADVNRTTLPLRDKIETTPAPLHDEPDLESQIRALKKREATAKQRTEEERKARFAVEQQRAQEAIRGRSELEQTQYDSVANALEARKAAAQQAKQEYASARAANDPIAEAEALERMQRVNADIPTLEQGKTQLEQRIQQTRNTPPQVQSTDPNMAVENVLSRMAALSNEERDWIRKHPDSVLDNRNVMLMQGAYIEAERKGIKRGSPEYFQLFEDRLGYQPEDDDTATEYDDVDDDVVENVPRVESPPLQPRQRPASAAPPSRSAPGASTRQTDMSSGKVTLTPQQREAARIAGVDERTYAQGVQRLNDLKKRGYYQETG